MEPDEPAPPTGNAAFDELLRTGACEPLDWRAFVGCWQGDAAGVEGEDDG